jgi:hypothetical protein
LKSLRVSLSMSVSVPSRNAGRLCCFFGAIPQVGDDLIFADGAARAFLCAEQAQTREPCPFVANAAS